MINNIFAPLITSSVALGLGIFNIIQGRKWHKEDDKKQHEIEIEQAYNVALSIFHKFDESDNHQYYHSKIGTLSGAAMKFECYKGFIKQAKEVYIENGRVKIIDLPIMSMKKLIEIKKLTPVHEFRFRHRPYLPITKKVDSSVYSVIFTIYEDFLGNHQIFMHLFAFDEYTKNIEAHITYDDISLLMLESPKVDGPSIVVERFSSKHEMMLQTLTEEYLEQFNRFKNQIKP